MSWTFVENVDGQQLWPRRRALPGPGGLRWHMSSRRDLEPALGDLGLLTGDLEGMQRVAESLTRMRQSSGMQSEVQLVEIPS